MNRKAYCFFVGWPVLTMLDIHFVWSSVTPINLAFTPSHAEKKTEHFLALISDYPLCIYCNFYFISFFLTFYLFSRPHKCPEPKYRYYAPSNLTTRLKRREVRILEVETDKWVYMCFFSPIEQLSCPKLQFTRLVYVNVHPKNSRISFLLSCFLSFCSFFSVGHTSSRGVQWRKVQSAICLRQVRAGLGLF